MLPLTLGTNMSVNFKWLFDLERYIWDTDYRDAPAWQRITVNILRTVLRLLGREFLRGDLNMRAMSLVYTTLLSIVPLLALSFSILKGFGVQNRLDETLTAALEPLGADNATRITTNMIEFVNNMNVGVLGAVGLGFLIYTVVSLVHKIETAFNHVWHVRESRSIGELFATFLSAIAVGPLLLVAAMAIAGSAMNTELMETLRSISVIGAAIDFIISWVPLVLVVGAFTFLYMFIPNTRVRFIPALTGGVVAGALWKVLSAVFTGYVSGASTYQVVYATFATAIFFMIWLYLNWWILLVGASIAFYRQHPGMIATGFSRVRFSPALTAEYALSLLAKVGRRFYDKEPAHTLEALADEYDMDTHVLAECLDMLMDLGILRETDDDPHRYVPGVPYDTTTVLEVIESLESHQPLDTYAPPPIEDDDIRAIHRASSRGRTEALAGLTLKQLALSDLDEVRADMPVSETPGQAANGREN